LTNLSQNSNIFIDNKLINLSPKEKLNLILGEDFELIFDSKLKGQFNMDFDFGRVNEFNEFNEFNKFNNESKLNSKIQTKSMLRFYGWEPYCLSLGYNQKEENILVNNLALKKYDLVRRPTGGRAVFHSNEITYSCVFDLTATTQRLISIGYLNTTVNYTHRDFYQDIHLILVEIFSNIPNIGDKLDFSKKDTNFKSHYKSISSMSCFTSSARFEITSQNKKIVGSAQRLFGNILLQHGSILLGREHLEIVDFLNIKDEEKQNFKNELEKSSISLSEIADREISFEEITDIVKNQLKL